MNKALNKGKRSKQNKVLPRFTGNYVPPAEAINPNQPDLNNPKLNTGLDKSSMVDLYNLAA